MNVRILARVVVYDKKSNRILLVRNKNTDFWYVPGGGWEYEKENIKECGVREVKEETGLDIAIDKFLYLREYHDSDTVIFFETFWLSHIKNDADLNKDHVDMDPAGKVEEARWFTQQELSSVTIFPDFLKAKFWSDVEKISNDEDRFVGF